jgi:hypothetical protein
MNLLNKNKFDWIKKRKVLSVLSLSLLTGYCIGTFVIYNLLLNLIKLIVESKFSDNCLFIAVAIGMIVLATYLIRLGYLRWIALESIEEVIWKDLLLYFTIGISLFFISVIVPILVVALFLLRFL